MKLEVLKIGTKRLSRKERQVPFSLSESKHSELLFFGWVQVNYFLTLVPTVPAILRPNGALCPQSPPPPSVGCWDCCCRFVLSQLIGKSRAFQRLVWFSRGEVHRGDKWLWRGAISKYHLTILLTPKSGMRRLRFWSPEPGLALSQGNSLVTLSAWVSLTFYHQLHSCCRISAYCKDVKNKKPGMRVWTLWVLCFIIWCW